MNLVWLLGENFCWHGWRMVDGERNEGDACTDDKT